MAVVNISTKELEKMIKEKADKLEIVDVRQQQEYDIVRLKNSKLISMEEISAGADEIDWKKEVVFVCRTGARSFMVADFFAHQGKTVKNLEAGLYEYYISGNRNDLEIDLGAINLYF